MTLQQLQQAERELLSALEENRKQQRDLNTKAFVDKYGIDIGDEVEFIDEIFTVTHISEHNICTIQKFNSEGISLSGYYITNINKIKLIKKATKK